jgi:hypothetical protein
MISVSRTFGCAVAVDVGAIVLVAVGIGVSVGADVADAAGSCATPQAALDMANRNNIPARKIVVMDRLVFMILSFWN